MLHGGRAEEGRVVVIMVRQMILTQVRGASIHAEGGVLLVLVVVVSSTGIIFSVHRIGSSTCSWVGRAVFSRTSHAVRVIKTNQ